MIPRYSRPAMQNIWSDETRFSIWLQIETLALEQMVKEGLAPEVALARVREKARFSAPRVLEIEAEVKHDVIAFLTNVAEEVGPEARSLHRGMTSSDVLDTALAVQLTRAGKLLLEGLQRIFKALHSRALQYQYTPCIGRSHGIHAEPITFGLKFAAWYAEMKRAEARLTAALSEVAVGKIAGAVGTYASVSPEVEAHVLSALGLKPETVPSQIVHRDRHAAFFSALALLATSIEKFSIEVRHLQRTEVREAEEFFSSGQKGSSAMPHKRNPILSENLCGLARLVRSYSIAALEDVPLWHERDISHSAVERVIAPDACIVVDFMLTRFAGLIEGLVVHEDRLKENLDLTRGIYFSGTLLLALVDNGMTREEAYRLVQKHALAAWDGGADFRTRVEEDARIIALLGREKITAVFDLKRHFRHVDMIFERTFKL